MLVPSDAWLTTLREAGEWIANESGERDVARVVLILRLALVLSPAFKIDSPHSDGVYRMSLY